MKINGRTKSSNLKQWWKIKRYSLNLRKPLFLNFKIIRKFTNRSMMTMKDESKRCKRHSKSFKTNTFWAIMNWRRSSFKIKNSDSDLKSKSMSYVRRMSNLMIQQTSDSMRLRWLKKESKLLAISFKNLKRRQSERKKSLISWLPRRSNYHIKLTSQRC